MTLSRTLQGLAITLGNISLKNAMEPVLDHIGQQVEDEVKREIGEYQSGIGPYGPTAELSDVTIDIKIRDGYGKSGNPDTPLYASGAFHDDVQHTVHKDNLAVEIGTDKKYIKYSELGTNDEPPRPIFGPAALRAVPPLLPVVSNGLVMAMEGKTFTPRGINAVIQP